MKVYTVLCSWDCDGSRDTDYLREYCGVFKTMEEAEKRVESIIGECTDINEDYVRSFWIEEEVL